MKRLTVKKIDEFISILESLERTRDELAEQYRSDAISYLKNYADRLDYMGKKSVKTKE